MAEPTEPSGKGISCDSCERRPPDGVVKTTLVRRGWRWHDAGDGRHFVMCSRCERNYAEVRELNQKVLVRVPGEGRGS